MKKGFLVTFEGGDGCGKGTQIRLFKQYLQKKGIDFIAIREPGGTPVGEKVRELLLSPDYSMSSQTEFLLFSASRRALVEQVIIPALESGKVVVMDRFYDSSFVYQGYAGNIEISKIKEITNFATSGLEPNLTFVLDISFEESMRRKMADESLKNLDRIEQKGKVFHDKVRQGYLNLAKQEPDRIMLIDATKSREEISTQIDAEFGKRFDLENQ